jgi:hypothetical protein
MQEESAMAVRKHGCGFSVQLKSKDFVKSLSVSHEGRNDVLIEGVLGELDELEVIEGSVLKIKGTSGTLMVDLTEDELRKALAKKGGKS